MRNPRNYSKLLLSPALTLVVLMSGAILPQRQSRVEAAGHAHPQTNYSTVAGDLITPRATTSATLLPNGKVLIACGYGTFGSQLSGPLNSAELYDPATRTWSSTGNLSTAHGGEEFTTTLMQNGKVLVVGGFSGFAVLNSAELYDPATGTWSSTGNLNTARTYHAATLLANGEVLVVGGENSGLLTSAELYNPATGTWRSTGNLNFARSYHTATLLPNGKVLVVEGYGAGNTAELYDPATGTWSPTGNLSKSYYWHTTTLLRSGKVLVVGSLHSGTNKTTELYDPATGMWTVTGPLNFGRLFHTATLLSNGKVLVLGGSDRPSSTVYDSAELYDPVTGAWTLAANLNAPRTWHTATMLPNGKVLIAGGGNASGLLSSTELYDPAANSPTNPIILTEENSSSAVALDSVTFVRDPFRLVASHNFRADQRTRVMLFAINVDLLPGEDASAVTARLEDSQNMVYPLAVEFVSDVPNLGGVMQLNVRLPDDLIVSGEVRISISVHGLVSNKVTIRIAQ
ncbi:MAG TPA: kelch repeat-containing protein [Pyrinomonadaceae bacterium]|nr:kelch repeat-containing protein [Pyrinomonadaceae bacterium]